MSNFKPKFVKWVYSEKYFNLKYKLHIFLKRKKRLPVVWKAFFMVCEMTSKTDLNVLFTRPTFEQKSV